MNVFSPMMDKFSALSLRHRVLAVAMMCALLVLGGNEVLWKPLSQETARLRTIESNRSVELAKALKDLADLDSLHERGVDPLAKELAQRDEFLRKIAEADAFFARHDATQGQVKSMVHSLLKETSGVELVSLKTLASQVFYTPPPPPPPPKATEKALKSAGDTLSEMGKLLREAEPKPTQPAAKPVAYQKIIYKHGVEISVKGTYAQLMSYAGKLQSAPQRMFWSEMQLTVPSHPVNVLRIVIYTLSHESVTPLS